MPALSDTEMGGTIDAIHDLPTDVFYHDRDDLEKRLVRKLDLRLSVILVLYTLNMIDRSNVSNARLQGFENDLHLEGQQYATILSILYIGFIVIEVPGNMFLHWLERPSIFIPSCMIVWGAISVSIGFTTNYTGVLVARLFLGFAEGPFLPGALFLISGWYKRDELATRTALISSGILFSAAFGSLFASGILQGMQGVLGQAAWRWLFYIEGGITILVAICAIFVLPDFPHNTRWLTPEERALAISRLEEDGVGKPGKQSTMQGLWDAISDWKVWWFSVAFMFQYIAQCFFAYFPTLCATLGYDTTTTLLLCAPPWAFAAIVAFALTWYSDKKQKRYKYYLVSNALGTLAYIISIFTMNKAARYISMFLMAQLIAGYLVLWGWANNTFAREPAKRAVAIALMNGMGQIGNIVGSYAWPLNWGPTYRYSYVVSIAAMGVSTVMFGGMYVYLKHLNGQIERDEQSAKDIKELHFPTGFRYLV
ncbi:major facilitator superfamily domain-containing protein [Suillus subluteus]|nr:major facilitator superfamily domain-containing protein [Suillus subluteus]